MEALGQTYDPKATMALLPLLKKPDFGVQLRVINALAYLRGHETFEPLRELLDDDQIDSQLRDAAARSLIQVDRHTGETAIEKVIAKEKDESVRHNLNVVLQSKGDWGYWPPDLLSLRQLTRDAQTIEGERFGNTEFEQFIRHIESDNWAVSSGCLYALGELGVESAVPAILKLDPHYWAGCNALAKLATSEAVRVLLDRVQSPDENIRSAAISALGTDGGKWAVPVLIELLDDPTLRRSNRVFSSRPWPDEHSAHAALRQCLYRAGLAGEKRVNLASGSGTFNVDKEIERAKTWWASFGNDFLAGRSVPDPGLSGVFWSS